MKELAQSRNAPEGLTAWPDDLFAPSLYDKALLAPERAETLPAWCYGSETFLNREIDRAFRPKWLCVGRHDRCPEVGDFAAIDLAGLPVILLRDPKGKLRAFANSCRHRGMRLLEGEGRCKGIKCPYHGWYYRLDGSLAQALEMRATEGFEKADHGLLELPLAASAGFVFVNPDGQAEPLGRYLEGFEELLAPYRLQEMVCTRTRSFEVACNWKLFIDIFLEYYHLRSVHPESLALVGYQTPDPPDAVGGQFISQFGRHAGSSAILKDGNAESFPAIKGLSGKLAGGTRYSQVFPNLIFGLTTDSLWFYQCHPLAPDRTSVVMGCCFPEETAARKDFERIAQHYYRRWDLGIAEDNAVLERQQKSIASPLTRPGRYSHLEEMLPCFASWLLRQVL
jgi:phenylpropionate dioxygenase-like ring-hydroxylating dioxygenase large terminal subunit